MKKPEAIEIASELIPNSEYLYACAYVVPSEVMFTVKWTVEARFITGNIYVLNEEEFDNGALLTEGEARYTANRGMQHNIQQINRNRTAYQRIAREKIMDSTREVLRNDEH